MSLLAGNTYLSYQLGEVPQATIQEYLDRAEKICLELKLPLLTEVQKLKANLQ